MKTEQAVMLEREELKLVGYAITESLNHVLESRIVGELREELERRRNVIEYRIGTGMYLIQIYPNDGHWTPDVPYRHVVAFEVASYGNIPSRMTSHAVAAGQYVKFIHNGPESKIGSTYEFINNTFGARPVDIEFWNDIHSLESEDSRIDIYVPAG